MPAQAALNRGHSSGPTQSARFAVHRPQRPPGGQQGTWPHPRLAQEVEATDNVKERPQQDPQSADAARKEQSILRDLPQAHRR
jgi:hypothetical protein